MKFKFRMTEEEINEELERVGGELLVWVPDSFGDAQAMWITREKLESLKQENNIEFFAAGEEVYVK